MMTVGSTLQTVVKTNQGYIPVAFNTVPDTEQILDKYALH